MDFTPCPEYRDCPVLTGLMGAPGFRALRELKWGFKKMIVYINVITYSYNIVQCPGSVV